MGSQSQGLGSGKVSVVKILAIAIGLFLGGTAAALWLYTERWFADKTFWSSCQKLLRKVLEDPGSDEFFTHYLRLLRSLGSYLGKTTCRVAITVLPIIIALHFFTPVITRQQAEQATTLCVYPEQEDVKLVVDGNALPGIENDFRWPEASNNTVTIQSGTWQHEVDCSETTLATNSQAMSTIYQACGYRTLFDLSLIHILTLPTICSV